MEKAINMLAAQQADLTRTMQDFVTTQPQALAGAMREVLTDREVLAKVGATSAEILQEAAVQQTGGIVWGVLRKLAGDWLVRIAVVLVVLKLAGIDAATKALGIVTGGKV